MAHLLRLMSFMLRLSLTPLGGCEAILKSIKKLIINDHCDQTGLTTIYSGCFNFVAFESLAILESKHNNGIENIQLLTLNYQSCG